MFTRIVLFFLLMAAPALASDRDWRVAKASQNVSYSLDGKSWKSVQVGDTIPNKAWIATGERARVQLVRGVESIAFNPGTIQHRDQGFSGSQDEHPAGFRYD